jgi:hypothetical protein
MGWSPQPEEGFELLSLETVEACGGADPERSICSLGERVYRTAENASLIPRGVTHLIGRLGSGPEATIPNASTNSSDASDSRG